MKENEQTNRHLNLRLIAAIAVGASSITGGLVYFVGPEEIYKQVTDDFGKSCEEKYPDDAELCESDRPWSPTSPWG